MLFCFKSSHLAKVSIFVMTLIVSVTFPLITQKSQTATDSTGASFLAAAKAQESDGVISPARSKGQSSSSSSPTKTRGGPGLDSEDDAPTLKRIPEEDFPKDDEEDLDAAALRVAKTLASQSCGGVGEPVNATKFSAMARQIKPGVSLTDRQIRDAFERFAQDSLELSIPEQGEKFYSPERDRRTNGELKNVVPDGIGDVLITERSGKVVRYPDSTFWEAKLVGEGKSIGPAYGPYQTLGYLDYLSHYSTAAKAIKPIYHQPTGFLIYLNPAGVGLTAGVLNYRGQTPSVRFVPVAVYQAVACRNPKAQPGVLRMGRSILLNGNRFAGYPPSPATLPPGGPAKIRFPF